MPTEFSQTPRSPPRFFGLLNLFHSLLCNSAMRVAYARCSTNQQDATRQARRTEGIRRRRDPLQRTPSGKTLEREVFQKVLAGLQPGDTLVVHELDRLGRSMIQMLQCAEDLMERGIGLITLDGKLNTDCDGSHRS